MEIIDATLLRVLRLQPAKQAEWQQLKRVTVKGSVARGGVAAVESAPRLVESSTGQIVTSPTQAKTAA